MFFVIAGDPTLEVRVEQDKQKKRSDDGERHEDRERPRSAQPDEFPARWDQPKSSVEKAGVPVGLAAGGGIPRVGRAIQPDRGYRRRRRDEEEDADHDQQQSGRSSGAGGQDPRADHVRLGATGARELRRPLPIADPDAGGQQDDEKCGHDGDVDRIEVGDDFPGKLTAEKETGCSRAHHRHRENDTLNDSAARCPRACRPAGHTRSSRRREP